MFNVPKDNLEEGDDILENDFDKKDTLADPPPGIVFKHDPIPSAFWYSLLGKVRQKPDQPGYVCFPVGTQTWHLFNASVIPLGRMAVRIATFLTGKHKPTYDHSRISAEDQGDFVVVVNGRYPLVYGKKAKLKQYLSHSTYPGGLHKKNIVNVLDSNSFADVVKHAVHGMLPRTNVRPYYMRRLQIFPDMFHDLKHLPQFLQRPVNNALADLGLDKVLTEGTIIYSSTPDKLPPPIKDLKFDPNDEALKPFDEKRFVRGFNSRDQKIMRRYRKVLLRYRTFNYKTKKFEV